MADMADFVTAMKVVDPSIKVVVPAMAPVPNPTGLAQAHAWNQTLVDNSMGDNVYGLSVNLYYDSEITPIRGVNVMKSGLDHLDAIAAAQNLLGGNQLHVMIGEHAHAIDLDQNNQPVEPGDPDFAMQWQGAIGTANSSMMASNLDYFDAPLLSVWQRQGSMAHRCGMMVTRMAIRCIPSCRQPSCTNYSGRLCSMRHFP